MPLQFDRSAEVLIGTAGFENAIGISELRISFDIKKTTKSTANTATVEIYNLSMESYNKIANSILKSNLILKAGYKDTADLDRILFSGDVVDFSRSVKGPDIITKFECSDGAKTISFSRKSVSYKAGISAKKILGDLISQFPIANQHNFEIPNVDDIEYGNGFSGSGKVADMITVLTDALSLEWSIQNGELKVVRKNGDDGSRGVLISPNSGMIGSPERINDVAIDGQKESGVSGWKVKCLLQPLLEPNGVVGMECEAIGKNTFFKIVSVDHSGDTHDDRWFTVLEVIERGK